MPTLYEHINKGKEILKQQEVASIFGTTRTCMRFKKENKEEPILLEKDGWVLRYFNIRPHNTSDYILYRQEDVDKYKFYESIPVIEFNCDNETLKFNKFCHSTILKNIPDVVHTLIKEFIESDNQTSDTKP